MSRNQQDTPAQRATRCKDIALELGFDACGIAAVGSPIDPENRLDRWIEAGHHGTMNWMARTAGVRADITRKLPNARSVLVVARNYYSERPATKGNTGRVARYAWGRDYHRVLRKPLLRLARFVDTLLPGSRSYASIDTGPILERAWAARAGVAAIGKNSLGLRRDLGSWFFLGTIVTEVELAPDRPAHDLCGTCTLCIDACPTAAIVEPRVVDSRRCISYQTIENRGEIPAELHAAHGDWVFGCDVCQEVCPWNRFARETTETAFRPVDSQANPDVDELAEMDAAAFDARIAGTPLRRAKWAGIRRNASIVQRNIQARSRECDGRIEKGGGASSE